MRAVLLLSLMGVAAAVSGVAQDQSLALINTVQGLKASSSYSAGTNVHMAVDNAACAAYDLSPNIGDCTVFRSLTNTNDVTLDIDLGMFDGPALQPPTCGGQYTESQGRFSDPSYPGLSYAKNQECKWDINPPGASSVELWFNRLATESGYDFVHLLRESGWFYVQEAKVSGTLASLDTNRWTVSTPMRVVFTSDELVVGLGFELEWRVVDAPLPETMWQLHQISFRIRDHSSSVAEASLLSSTDAAFTSTSDVTSNMQLSRSEGTDSDGLVTEQFFDVQSPEGSVGRFVRLVLHDNFGSSSHVEVMDVRFWGVATPPFVCVGDDGSIPGHKRCDGDVDCPLKKSDECACNPNNPQYMCNSGLCLDQSRVCDGVSDCDNAGDEQGCGELQLSPSPTELTVSEGGTGQSFQAGVGGLTLQESVKLTFVYDSTQVTIEPSIITIQPGQQSVLQDVQVTAIDDQTDDSVNGADPVYPFSVTSSSADPRLNAREFSNVGTVTVRDNRFQAGVSMSPPSASITKGATQCYTATLTSRPLSPVTVRLTSNAPATKLTMPAALVIAVDDWQSPSQLCVVSPADYNSAPPQAYTVSAGCSSPDPNYQGVSGDVALTVTSIPAGVQVTPQLLNHTEGATAPTFSVVLASQPVNAVSLTFTASAECQLSLTTTSPGASSVTHVFSSASWSVAAAVRVVVEDDDVFLGDRTCIVAFDAQSSDPAYGALSEEQVVQVYIADDEDVSMEVQPLRLSVVARGTAAPLKIRFGFRPAEDVIVNLLCTSAGAVCDPAIHAISPAVEQLRVDADDWSQWTTTKVSLDASASTTTEWWLLYVSVVGVSGTRFDSLATVVNVTLSCTAETNCNAYGVCGTNNECECATGFTGGEPGNQCSECDQAAGFYRFPACMPCDASSGSCNGVGQCNTDPAIPGLCVCDNTNMNSDCSGCAPGHWRSLLDPTGDCLPCPGVDQGADLVCGGASRGTCDVGTGQCLCERRHGPAQSDTSCDQPYVYGISPNTTSPNGGEMVAVSGSKLAFNGEYAFVHLVMYPNATSSFADGTVVSVTRRDDQGVEFFMPALTAPGHSIFLRLEARQSGSAAVADAMSNMVELRLACGDNEYTFPACSYCSRIDTCSGRGECKVDGQCECDEQFRGAADCSACTIGDFNFDDGCRYTASLPVVSAVVYDPSQVVTDGGAVLKVFGSSLGPQDPAHLGTCARRVLLRNIDNVELECLNPDMHSSKIMLTCTIPEGFGRGFKVAVEVCDQRSVEAPAASFDYPPPAVLDSKISSTANGTLTVRFFGRNFGSEDATPALVGYVSGVQCSTTTRLSHSSLLCELPADGIGTTHELSVSVGGQISCVDQPRISPCPKFSFPAPSVSRVDAPADVPTEGGMPILVYGSNFGDALSQPSVSVGNQACLSSRFVDNGVVECVVPRGSGANLPVTVSVAGQASVASDAQDASFSFAAPRVSDVIYASDAASTSGGTQVIVRGQHLGDEQSTVAVSVGTYACSNTTFRYFNSSSGSLMGTAADVSNAERVVVCSTPQGWGAGHRVSVAIQGQLSAVHSNAVFSYNAPVVTSIEPLSVLTDTESRITITGHNFGFDTRSSGLRVRIGDFFCSTLVLANKHSQLMCRTPRFSTVGLHDVKVIVGGQDSNAFQLEVTHPTLSDTWRTIIFVWVLFTLFVLLLMLIGVLAFRGRTVMLASSPLFLMLILVGGMISVSSQLFLEERTSPTCHLDYMLLSVGFIVLYGSLMVKNFRVLRIFNTRMKHVVISNLELLKYLAIMLLVDVALLTPFAVVTGCKPLGNDPGVWFMAALIGSWQLLILFSGFVIAFKSRVITQDLFNERVAIGYAIYNITVCTLIMVVIGLVFESDYSAVRVIQGVGVPFVVLVTTLCLFAPKFYYLFRRRGGRSPDGHSLHTSAVQSSAMPESRLDQGLPQMTSYSHGSTGGGSAPRTEMTQYSDKAMGRVVQEELNRQRETVTGSAGSMAVT